MNGVRTVIIQAVFCVLALFTAPVLAQPTSATDNPEQLASEVDGGQLQSLIDTLEDPERRAIFLERLNTLRAVQQQDQATTGDAALIPARLVDRLMDTASGAVASLTSRLQSAADYIGTAPATFNRFRSALTNSEDRKVITEIIAKIAATFIAALAGAWLMDRLLGRPWEKIRERSATNVFNNLLLLVMALVLRLLPLAVFLGIAYLALSLLDPKPVTRTILLSLVYAHLFAQAVMIAARTVLVVDHPELRPYRLQNETAAYIYLWIRRITIVAVYGYFINQALLSLGMDATSQSLLVDLTGMIVALLFVAVILQNRQPVARALRGDEQVVGITGQLRGTLGMFWHLLAILYVIGVYVVWVAEVEGGFAFLVWRTLATLVIVIATLLAQAGAQRGIKKLFHLPRRLREQYPDLEQRADRYRPAVTRVLKVILVSAAVIAIAQAWGLNAAGLLTTGAGQGFLTRLVRILLIVAVGFLVWEVTAALIERKLRAAGDNNRRLMTVLPLLKNVVRMTIGTVAVMIVLSELGMNIAPLIATAGVIGLAVGFGAQTLVRDLISGMFVIFEDIIAVGDWVEIGAHTGIVEAMHIRTMELRDLSGNIRVIPFGEVTSVHKVANDYSYALIVIGVAYREDVEEVMGLLSQVGEEMQQDEEWKDIILEPLMVDGLNEMAASSIDIRLRIKCKPLQQWALRREFLRRTKKLFDEQGVEIPFPHQTVYFGQDKDGSAPAAHIRLQEMARELGENTETDRGNDGEATHPGG